MLQTITNPNDILIDTYVQNNVGIDTQFLSKAMCDGLQQNIKHLQQDNLMQPAGIGNHKTKDANQKIRGDKIYWMDKAHDNIFEQQFLQQIDGFIERLNSTCYTGINDYEFHYAVYEAGSGYKRHIDQFKNDSNRKYSLINYLNNGWVQADGGELLLYGNMETQTIQPHAQTAILFKSNEMEHEVANANKTRMSISGWLKRG